ncbi:Crp/Fnr family transcriptional regulator [Aquabacterium sp. OR-4]|uniref:Crp/Fnr family transcriptional regulator n=1 Tax=Aquabacterium sp. OR-4 TaxID=2978127 RepID=UPI0021B272AC|nr:Crp/Fnr family transcriptional regulator [Aquabacterium sp. OR-4]MDT7833908.1 Crp/Fnr family transcriptional regulator [Aquabacterium sp. OR-4]
MFNPQARICLDCGVRRSALFGVLEADALEQLHGHIADLHVQPGQRLFSANDPGLAAFTVREGVVRLERMSERGERRIVRLAGRSDLIGLEALLGQTCAADAVACTPVKVCRLPRLMIDELAKGHPEMLRDLMKRWQAALDEAEEWLTELTAGSARWRMLRLLLKISEFGDADGRVWLPSRQQMGAMLGMTVETASRLVSALKREGVLLAADTGHARLVMPALLAALKTLSDAG